MGEDEMEFQESQQEREPGAPDPTNFQNYDEYVSAMVDFRISKHGLAVGDIPERVGDAVTRSLLTHAHEAARPKPPAATPFPDDPHRHEREELARQSLEYGQEAYRAEDTGRSDEARRWRERQRQVEKEIERLPEAPEIQFRKMVEDGQWFVGAEGLLDEKNADNEQFWNDPRILHDAPLAVVQANKRSRNGFLLLPEEIGAAFGNLAPCKPSSMVQFKLPPDVAESFKKEVYSSGGSDDPDAVLRKSWAVLHKLGYAGTGTRAFEPKAESGDREKSPDAMSFVEFCRWREEGEKPRTPFVFPRRAGR